MKRFVLLCIVLSSFVSFAQRLPELARPVNYQLTFAPDFEKNIFSGQETIAIQILKPTSEIVLNAAEIDFLSASITTAGTTQEAAVAVDKVKQMATLTVAHTLATGPATIQIHFNGLLNGELRGFYLGKDETGRKYAVTQFESTDARRAFPSFDEPAYKATFDITVIADKKHVALSNAKVLSDTSGPVEGKHTVKFATSAKMSSYLVAIAVGEFEAVEGEADGIPIRVWGTPGKKKLGGFALEGAKSFMHYYDGYFGIKYPFEKLDLIGLPDFEAGAMENTGLITFREALLLLDDKRASIALKRDVADVISHEMAHMWFGDLVTMQWWDDIWLNEGFATWMSPKPVSAWKPEWHVELESVRDTIRSQGVDSLLHTRPIQQAAETPDEIQELFDGIAYGKTAAVLRMLEAYIGPESFRAGVTQYLKQHSYGNATATDFWSTLSKASGKPVDQVMPTFVQQAGLPFVAVHADCNAGTTQVTLHQQRYFFDRELFSRDDSKALWQVPVCLKEDGSPNTSKTCHLLTEKEARFNLPACGNWTLANAGAEGFYRSGYDASNIRGLARDVETGLTPGERIMLLGDVWASVRVGKKPVSDYLALAEGLQNETSRPVLSELLSQLEYIDHYLTSEQDQPQYSAWVRQLLAPSIHRLGFESKSGESEEDKQLRFRVMEVAGGVGHDPEVLAWARKWTSRSLSNTAPLDNTIAETAFALAARDGDSSLYDRLLEKQKLVQTPEDFYIYLDALLAFRDPKLIERNLSRVLSPEVRSQDAAVVISEIMSMPTGGTPAWEFTKRHWDEIAKLSSGSAARVVEATATFCSAEQGAQVSDFFTSHKVASAERGLNQSLEGIRNCADLKSQQAPRLAQWLSNHEIHAGQ
ncbi:MAG: M1 family metallopeptidase [Acidobacteria bacterium]|nr:M1 family metallopeptidase [Acidobacteriota bacterium]